MSDDILTPRAPSAAGVDAAAIAGFLDALEANPGIHPHGLVVLHDGFRIAEGSWAPYSAERRQHLYSLSKSFTTTAVGLARQEGLVDLDATVLSYFPEWDADITDPRSRRMTVRHIAAMSSGHAAETIDRAYALDPAEPVRGFLLLPPDAEPGSVFAYNQPCTYALAAIVQRVSGMTLVDYLRPRVFDPLGIGDVAWQEGPPGRNIGFSGLHATTDAVARLGELYRRGGMWGDRRILDEEWVALATSRQVATPPSDTPDWSQGYGFQFWMARHGYRGDGAFGQFCVVVPEARLVVALTSESPNMQAVLDAVWAHLLPAIGAGGDAAADAVLAGRLAALRHPAPRFAADPPEAAAWVDRRFPADAGARRAASVTAVRVGTGPAGRLLELTDASGTYPVPFAADRWVVGEARGVPVAACGGWTTDGRLRVEVLFLESPHSLRVTCSPESGRAEVSWVTVPLGEAPLAAMRAPTR